MTIQATSNALEHPRFAQNLPILPTFPTVKSLAGRSLAPLLRGEKISHRDFQNRTATYRLSEFIRILRHKHGWPIVTRPRHARTQDPTGRSADFGIYEIKTEDLAFLRIHFGERINSFIASVERFERGGL